MTSVDELRSALVTAAVPGRAEQEKRYLKSDLDFVGVPLPGVRKIVKAAARDISSLDELRLLVDELWKTGVYECRLSACLFLEIRVSLLSAPDLDLLESLIRDARTWALVDVLAGDVAGLILLREPEAEAVFRRWAADDDEWVRRSGLLAFLRVLHDPASWGQYFPVFCELADPVLSDPRFFVRKAIGWVLRESSKRHPREVYEWSLPRASRMSGVTMREVVRRLPADLAAELAAAR